MCRRYVSKQINTQWMCAKCSMPLCNVCRGRSQVGLSLLREYHLFDSLFPNSHPQQTCLQEHLNSDDPVLGCGLLTRGVNDFKMPNGYKLYECTPVATPNPRKRSGVGHSSNSGGTGVAKRARGSFATPSPDSTRRSTRSRAT